MTPYDALVRVFLHLDRTENLLVSLGNAQTMSVGKFTEDIEQLREQVLDQAIAYGAVPQDTTIGEMRHEAGELEIVVQAVEP